MIDIPPILPADHFQVDHPLKRPPTQVAVTFIPETRGQPAVLRFVSDPPEDLTSYRAAPRRVDEAIRKYGYVRGFSARVSRRPVEQIIDEEKQGIAELGFDPETLEEARKDLVFQAIHESKEYRSSVEKARRALKSIRREEFILANVLEALAIDLRSDANQEFRPAAEAQTRWLDAEISRVYHDLNLPPDFFGSKSVAEMESACTESLRNFQPTQMGVWYNGPSRMPAEVQAKVLAVLREWLASDQE